ncbi:MAG: peptidyl-prolyl cis-trans isomerase [Gammaproteobacteria bacterium]|nr:peptidyl-prolyl cis-trans isomerase [Gammaproteobacteria bacterium]
MRFGALAGIGIGLAIGAGLGWFGAIAWRAAPLPVPTTVSSPVVADFGYGTIEASLSRLAPARRRAVLDDAAAFAAFVEQRGRQQVLFAAATAAGLAERPSVAAELRETTIEVLAARYLEREAPAAAAPAPDDAAIDAFYRDQQARFRIPDRLPVWQIFIAAPVGDEAARTAARARARESLAALLAGKASLAELAARESEHTPSRLNGGFMGLLVPEELKPEVRQALLAAPQGKPIGPIETATGFHVVQRGALVPGSVPPLDEVRPQIVAWLTEQALAAQRTEVLRQAAEAHPVTIEAAELEPWRERLRDAEAAESVVTGTQK